MHLIVPFAGVMSEAGRAAARELTLPHLARALDRMEPQWLAAPAGADPEAPELSLTPPHEHAKALAWGLTVTDGQVPWAALEAARLGLPRAGAGSDVGSDVRSDVRFDIGPIKAWGRLTPAHWQLGTEQITMLAPQLLALDSAASVAFLEAVRPLFETEGFELHATEAGHWLTSHPVLADLPCASLDRVIGRNVDLWLPADPRARLVRRLQNEVQMFLHTHPLNEDRERRGALPINSFWLDGCGVAPAPPFAAGRAGSTDVIEDDRLRTPALNEDWFAWSRAFAQLDEGPIAHALQATREGQPVRLSLCGERQACTLTPRPLSAWQRLRRAWRPPSMAAVERFLEAL
jgi:hypothetical protein